MEKTLAMCRMAVDDGIHTIVATPHMLNGVHKVTIEAVHQSVRLLSETLEKNSIPLRILPGADVHVDNDLPDLLSRGEVITVAGKGRHLMVELPQDVLPRELQDLLFRIQLKGVTPLISHPERNGGIQQNPGFLSEMIQKGNLTQVTAGSLDGTFGSEIQRCALMLLRMNMIHVVATDAHNTSRRSPCLSKARRIVQEERGEEEARLLFSERPARILDGNYVEPPEPVAERTKGKKKKGFFKRLISN